MTRLFLLPLVAIVGCSNTSVFFDAGLSGDTALSADLTPIADAYVNPCAPQPGVTVSGRVFAPNGSDPVAGARIAVATEIKPLPQTVYCSTCFSLGSYGARTVSQADGTFTLTDAPPTPFRLAIVKGHFRRVIELKPSGCNTSLALDKAQTTLPGESKQYGPDDTAPNVAVVSGVWDRMERVLDKLGLKNKRVFNGRDPGTGPDSVQALLQNGALLKSFHLLFINCGSKFENLITSPGPARNNLQSYVRQGGRLFVTDLSYDFVEQTFPAYIDFHGSDQTPQAAAEDHNAAEVGGKALSVSADVVDEDLRKWLKLPEIDALSPGDKIELLGFKTGWAVPLSIDSTLGGKTWLSGEVAFVGGRAVRPLALSFDFADTDGAGCGRVVFSAPHVDANTDVTLAQERVLEYLMLEIGACYLVK